MSIIKQVSNTHSFGGKHQQYQHQSNTLDCLMRFAVYLPPQATKKHKVPVLYWLSGLTCNDENFMQKSGVQRVASELGIAIVAPDTSPRGNDIVDNEGYDLGQGAGFYVNATQMPWESHFQMYDYVLKELPLLIEENFPVSDMRSISGHSMGGHGALILGLRNPEFYQSISAFSPICNPIDCPWGIKAFTAYLGDNKEHWSDYDASILIAKAKHFLPTLVEQGASDNFLMEQLKPESLIYASKVSDYPLTYNLVDNYDHSYYFIASFIEKHLHFHAKYLFLSNNKILP